MGVLNHPVKKRPARTILSHPVVKPFPDQSLFFSGGKQVNRLHRIPGVFVRILPHVFQGLAQRFFGHGSFGHHGMPPVQVEFHFAPPTVVFLFLSGRFFGLTTWLINYFVF